MLDWLISNWGAITACIGSALGTAALVVKLTPTDADDRFVAKLMALFRGREEAYFEIDPE